VTPTPEQTEAVTLFKNGGALKINAFAGSGKTTTLKLLSEATDRRGMYLAFNRSIANDAKSTFPRNVTCSTVHSLAYGATPSAYKRGDKMTGNMNANAVAQSLSLTDSIIGGVRLTARSQGHLVLATLRSFLQGPRPAPSDDDVPLTGKLETLSDKSIDAIRSVTSQRATDLWARMRSPADPIPLGHDGYLKLWALSKPELAADFILLDEAQDTNPVVLDVLSHQRAQIIYVGDRHQQIYEWRGAINAMELIDTPNVSHLTTSFRFGNTIASAANRVLAALGEEVQIQGNAGKSSFIGADNCEAILARTNAGVMSTVLRLLDQARSPHVIGGVAEIIRMLRGVQDLKRGEPSDVAEFFGFANWGEVTEFAKTSEGEHLMPFVSLVEQHGETRLISMLNRTAQDEASADIVVSTAHKAKGREWDTVELLDDFVRSRPKDPKTEEVPPIDPAEVRLFYVALTRGKTAVEVSPALMERFGIAVGPRYSRPAVSPKPVTLPASRQFAKPEKRPAVKPGLAPPPAHPSKAGSNWADWWWLIPLGLLGLALLS